jgi:tRNA-2-methylthio-N6-dimethylallyladenosine synthase
MTTAPTRKAFIKSFGCQMNAYDAERMGEILGAQGYGVSASPEDADLVVLNTCHIREKAVDKLYSELGKIREMKVLRAAAGHDMLIAVAGCVAQAEGEQIVAREKSVDMVFGPQTYHRLPDLLRARAILGKPVIETDFTGEAKFDDLAKTGKRAAQGHGVAAFLTVQEGCDKFCSFCVVPYTRGSEYSRPVAQVLAEARALVAAGVREITLLGQNVNAYRGAVHDGHASLAKLVAELSSIDGIDRIRYTTSHPRDMSDDLIQAHSDNAKLMPYLHLPVQSGSDRILKVMNRGHTADHYVKLIERIRATRPDMAISGDFIVGFPGETDQDFEDTLSVVRAVGYASAYSFKYSSRPGTPAAEREDQVDEDVKAERLQRLQALLAQQMQRFNADCVGRVLPVLIEKPGRNPGQVIGRSPYLQSVHLDLPSDQKGQIVQALVTETKPNSLSAVLAAALVAA